MNQGCHGEKIMCSTMMGLEASNQELIEEVVLPKSPSLDVLNQRWQKIRLLILQELASQSALR